MVGVDDVPKTVGELFPPPPPNGLGIDDVVIVGVAFVVGPPNGNEVEAPGIPLVPLLNVEDGVVVVVDDAPRLKGDFVSVGLVVVAVANGLIVEDVDEAPIPNGLGLASSNGLLDALDKSPPSAPRPVVAGGLATAVVANDVEPPTLKGDNVDDGVNAMSFLSEEDVGKPKGFATSVLSNVDEVVVAAVKPKGFAIEVELVVAVDVGVEVDNPKGEAVDVELFKSKPPPILAAPESGFINPKVGIEKAVSDAGVKVEVSIGTVVGVATFLTGD